MRRAFGVLIVSVLLTMLSACGPPVYHALPQPPTTLQPPIGLQPPRDYSGLRLSVFPGKTTTTQLNPAGMATLNGTVTSNGTPVGGATVIAERFVGTTSTQQTATSAVDGTYSFTNVVGGRYRVRAFRTPDMGMSAGVV